MAIEPTDADFVYGLGWTYEKSKKWSKAAEAYQQALDFDPQYLATQNNLAWILAETAVPPSRSTPKKLVDNTQNQFLTLHDSCVMCY